MSHFERKTFTILEVEGQTHVHVIDGNTVLEDSVPAECYVEVGDGIWERDGAQVAQGLADDLDELLAPVEG